MPQRGRRCRRSRRQRFVTEHTTVWDADTCIDDLITARLVAPPAALRQPGSGLYLLIDPFLGDPVLPSPLDEGLSMEDMNAQRSKAWQRPTFALRLPEALAMDNALAPYLVELSGIDDAWLDASVQWAIQETVQTWQDDGASPVAHRVGGWLQSAAQGPMLAKHLTPWLRLRTQARTQAHYLRLADRRVLGLTAHVLGADTMGASLSPVQHWHWLDAHAAWNTQSAAAPAPGPDGEHRHAGVAPLWPAFNAAQWTQMAQGPRIHRAMAEGIAQRLAQSDCTAPSRWAPINAAQWQAAVLASQLTGSDHLTPP